MVRETLSQVQIIRSLGEALGWFERELAWGVEPAELRHLTGRIGELYAAMVTRGQMALETNQRGYDVVGADGEHISVKTVTSSTHVAFRKSTLHHVHRVIVLRINVVEREAAIEELVDCAAAHLHEIATATADQYVVSVAPSRGPARPLADMVVVATAVNRDYAISKYENGTIIVRRDGVIEPHAKPALREIAARIGVSLLNAAGNDRNTRQLGAEVIAVLDAQREPTG